MKDPIKGQGGFTLIELMIVIAIIGILAVIAIPAYQDYATRAKMSEAISFAAAAKTAVTESYIGSGSFPTSNADAGLDTNTNMTSTYVTSVTVGTGGKVTIDLQGFGGDLDGYNLLMVPSAGTSGSQVTWLCGISNTAGYPYVPSSCRNDASGS